MTFPAQLAMDCAAATRYAVALLILMLCSACSVQPASDAQAQQAEDMRRIASGKEAQTSPNASYAKTIAIKIKSNTVFAVPKDLTENDPVVYEVNLFPDGSVRSVTKLKSSNLPGFDEAVMHAIMRAQPFPADSAGNRPQGFTFSHFPLAGNNVH